MRLREARQGQGAVMMRHMTPCEQHVNVHTDPPGPGARAPGWARSIYCAIKHLHTSYMYNETFMIKSYRDQVTVIFIQA